VAIFSESLIAKWYSARSVLCLQGGWEVMAGAKKAKGNAWGAGADKVHIC
jgi:hypothetical protein